MGYNFYGFNPWDFEELVQALFQKLLGNSSLVYGLGADGGRELTFEGKASFASPHVIQDGLWIVQAKFRSRDVHDHDQYGWVNTNFRAEMRKFGSGEYPVPDQYIFVTNAVLTPGFERGGRDKIQDQIIHYKNLIPNIYVIAYDELCKLLLNNADVRQAYDHFLSPGDQIAQVRKLLERQSINKPFVLAEGEIRNLPIQHNYNITLPVPRILTIDFGTSYSLCGVINTGGNVTLIPTASGGVLLNSTITFLKNGSYIVGNSTLRNARSSEFLTFSHVKRFLASGRRYDVYGTTYSADDLITLIIKSLKTSAEEYFGYDFKDVVVAKPANFNLRQTKALREVFEKAGFKVRRMLDEGTAPCYLFPKAEIVSVDNRNGMRFLVIDLGGGTFDLSLQEYDDNVYETKAVFGDNSLGGIDFDLAVLEFASIKMKRLFPRLADVDFSRYVYEAERVKKVLSNSEQASFVIADIDMGDGNLSDYSVSVTRDEFRNCTSALNVRVLRCLNDVVRSVNENGGGEKSIYHVEAIMLTGQGAKIFTVREIINDLYPNLPVIDQYMENAVCLGNAYQAGVLQGVVKDQLLLSVQNTGLAFMAKDRGNRNKQTKRTVVAISATPEFNLVYCTMLKANTTIPLKEVFEFDIEIKNSSQNYFELPIYEVSHGGSPYEEITKLSLPVVNGHNHIVLTLDIDANHVIIILTENVTNKFAKKVSIG